MRPIYSIAMNEARCGAVCHRKFVPVLKIGGKCSCVRAKPAHFPGHLPPTIRLKNRRTFALFTTWLFFRKEEDLKAEELETLQQLRQASSHLETAYHLVKAFLSMVRERTGEQLDAWLEAVQASHLEAFQPFVTGVQRDKDAVLAGLTLPWSNGPLEGHVNRLKLIKRSMYGHAEFDLLKRRVLHRSKRNQERKDKYKHHQGQQANLLLKNSTNSQHTITEISRVA